MNVQGILLAIFMSSLASCAAQNPSPPSSSTDTTSPVPDVAADTAADANDLDTVQDTHGDADLGDGATDCVDEGCKDSTHPCQSSKDCPDLCNEVLGLCVECLTDSDCADGDPCTLDSCGPGTGSCTHVKVPECKPPFLQPCTTNGDCKTGKCDGLLRACVVGSLCASDLQCKAAGQVCNIESGSCVECVTADDCGPDEACIGYQCLEAIPCKTSKQCAKVCDNEAGLCVDCISHQDCDAGLICSAHMCQPPVCGGEQCAGGLSYACKPAGDGYLPGVPCVDADPCTEDSCDPATGGCIHVKVTGCDACAYKLEGVSNTGCEFWTADLDVTTDPFVLTPSGTTADNEPHSIVIANPGVVEAVVTISLAGACADQLACQASNQCQVGKCGDAVLTPYTLSQLKVAAGKTAKADLPVMNIDGVSRSSRGVRITSSEPIAVWQFNVFDGSQGGSVSGDGSLMLPRQMLGTQYIAVTRKSAAPLNIPGLPNLSQQGYFTVVATSPGLTTVTVTVTADVAANAPAGIPALQSGTAFTLTLSQFEVLNLAANGSTILPPIDDLTGSLIASDQPIAVFAGHEEAVVSYAGGPNGKSCCADHLEEQLVPVSNWGMAYVCPKSKKRGVEHDVWVVVAGEDGVSLQTEPYIAGLDGKVLAKAGQWLEVTSEQSFELKASGKVQVTQFLVGRDQTSELVGDPTMMSIPATGQYRPNYLLQVPPGYEQRWLSIVRPSGTSVTLDGQEVNVPFSPVGDGTWQLAWVAVQSGPHLIEGNQPVGVWLYGYGKASAFGVPAGFGQPGP